MTTTPTTWADYHRSAAAYEAALGNDRAAAACLRDARRADVATELARMTALFQQRAITAAMGFGPTSLNQFNHNGANSPISGA